MARLDANTATVKALQNELACIDRCKIMLDLTEENVSLQRLKMFIDSEGKKVIQEQGTFGVKIQKADTSHPRV